MEEVKSFFHITVKINIFGLFIHGHQFAPPPNHFHQPCALFLVRVEFHVLPHALMCLLVEFDLRFVFGELACLK